MTLTARVPSAFVLLTICLVASGCDCGRPAPRDAGPPRAVPRGPTAVIVGSVRLAPGVELPRYAVNPMSPPGNARLPPECPPPQESDREPVHLVADRRLTGVLVALSEFTGAMPEHAPVTHELVIRDCRLTPRMIAATRGDRIHLVNETDYPFLPNTGGGMLQAIMRGRSRDIELGQAGYRPLTCGFGASCGRTEVTTTHHPLHTITDDRGRYRIENVPVGELHVNAWHPLFAESRQTVTLRAGETHTVDLVLSPARTRAPASPPPPPNGAQPPQKQPDVLF